MDVDLTSISTQRAGRPGQTMSYTLRLKNDGIITDNYIIVADSIFPTWLEDETYRGPRQFRLVSQEVISITVWVEVQPLSTLGFSSTISVQAFNGYGVEDDVELTLWVASFQENDGQAVMEAEHFTGQVNRANRTWLTQTVLSDFAGSSYLNIIPDAGLLFTTDYTSSSPELHYSLNFTTTGVYTVWIRGYAPDGAGDSVYVGLDDHLATALTDFEPRGWSWANQSTQGSPVTLEITEPGLHTLRIWQREDGLRLDRILLTTDSNLFPSGDGPLESESK
jgi:hypothetical protein